MESAAVEVAWFAIGTWSFWALVAVHIFFPFWVVDGCRYGWGLFSIVVTVAALWLIGGLPVWSWIHDNPGWFSLYAGLYVIAGLVWATAKWFTYGRNQKRKLFRHRGRFFDIYKDVNVENIGVQSRQQHEIDGADDPAQAAKDKVAEWKSAFAEGKIPKDLRKRWAEYCDQHNVRRSIPQIRENVDRLVTWALYWPWSFLWTFVSDLVIEALRSFFEYFKTFYQRVMDKIWADVDESLKAD